MFSNKKIKMEVFQRLPEIEDIQEINNKNFNKGDLFLAGESIIEQKNTKDCGDYVTIYKITEKSGDSIIYVPDYYMIEKEK